MYFKIVFPFQTFLASVILVSEN